MNILSQAETRETKSRRFIGYLLLAAVVVGLDQVSKYAALLNLFGRPPLEILPVFHLTLVFNRGAAFGFLAEAGGWQHYFLGGLATGIGLLLVAWLWRAPPRRAMLCYGLALVLGGAIGNLLDRVSHQYVIDFILLHYHGWRFPAFNLADSAIFIGAVLLFCDGFGWRRHAPRRGEPGG